MAEVNVRSDSVDVEQIMRQIRARIREKRGVDYTEAELRQLATVKLEKFLDPRGVRSDLLETFRAQMTVSPPPPNYEFEEGTLFETHRGALRSIRRLLRPVLKLFFNPDRITSALHLQAQVNMQAERRLRRLEEPVSLWYEMLHNLTMEITRLGIEMQNLKVRVESLSSRLDFDERRARSLEGVVQYRRAAPSPQGARSEVAPAVPAAPGTSSAPARPEQHGPGSEGGGERRRRRRRRRRRPGQTMGDAQRAGTAPAPPGAPSDLFDSSDDAGSADDSGGPDSTDQ
jgi:hypothetical protein